MQDRPLQVMSLLIYLLESPFDSPRPSPGLLLLLYMCVSYPLRIYRDNLLFSLGIWQQLILQMTTVSMLKCPSLTPQPREKMTNFISLVP